MQINVIYDASAAGAPAGFKTAVQAAVDYLDNLITNKLTLSINFGWGEVNGQALQSGALGENIAYGSYYTYSQLKAALGAQASTADDHAAMATLSAADPTAGGRFFITTPQAYALGLTSNAPGTAGYVGLNANYAYAFDPAHRAQAGAYDAIGVVIHELTEILGRSGALGVADGTNAFTALDLFRYAAPGVRALSPGAGSFSVDGQHLLLPFNDPTRVSGDSGDWNTAVIGDSFGPGFSGQMGAVSDVDLKVMDVLGYTLTGASLAPPQLVATSPGASATGVSLGAPIVFSFNEAIRLGTGQLQIHDAATGAVLTTIAMSDTSQVSLSPAAVVVRPSGGLPAGHSLYVTLDAGAVTDLSGTAFGGIQDASLAFTDKSAAATAGDLVRNVLRASATSGPFAGLAGAVADSLSQGAISFSDAIHQVSGTAVGSTSVATLAYEFFTGAVPSSGGLDYLLAPDGPNANNLNSAYYQSFNDANRYINFAVNLGKAGAGAASFAAQYGSMSLSDTAAHAYATIFGVTPSADKVSALLDAQVVSNGHPMSRTDYLALYGGDGTAGLGTKAALVGWLLSEAAHAGVGTYATANAAYLSDLAQGHAPFGVDLVGVYHGTPYLGG